jgi:leader peptidase (prepilin peptidase) / N-methyltransferase
MLPLQTVAHVTTSGHAVFGWHLWLSAIVGLCVGSFANVMGLRQLRDLSFLNPPSHCPQCKSTLTWWENIPVLSFLILRGQCRHCQTPISIQYPLIELASSGLFVALMWHFGWDWGTLVLGYLMLNLLSVVITDWRESLIYFSNSLYLVPFGLAYNLFGWDKQLTTLTGLSSWSLGPIVLSGSFLSALLGVVVAYSVFEGMIWLSKKYLGTEGFGHGDTFFLIGVASFLGWEMALIVLLLGCVFQAVLAVPILVGQWVKANDKTTLSLFGLLLLGMALVLGSPLLQQWGYKDAYVAAMILGMILALVVTVLFVKRIRETEQHTYMPMGPALVLATLACLFFGQSIMKPWLQSMKASSAVQGTESVALR